eukprot:TRINITY_DN37859_c0_g1_i1.p1 TRINITY_DN37859_c0_g1~~TRINITY_DN37859_c0_g1_i1.p1  ORF type:complete len:599 (+),score=79.75 TRINITY_DN37859_c0_g1_i1:41-1837(+)
MGFKRSLSPDRAELDHWASSLEDFEHRDARCRTPSPRTREIQREAHAKAGILSPVKTPNLTTSAASITDLWSFLLEAPNEDGGRCKSRSPRRYSAKRQRTGINGSISFAAAPSSIREIESDVVNMRGNARKQCFRVASSCTSPTQSQQSPVAKSPSTTRKDRARQFVREVISDLCAMPEKSTTESASMRANGGSRKVLTLSADETSRRLAFSFDGFKDDVGHSSSDSPRIQNEERQTIANGRSNSIVSSVASAPHTKTAGFHLRRAAFGEDAATTLPSRDGGNGAGNVRGSSGTSGFDIASSTSLTPFRMLSMAALRTFTPSTKATCLSVTGCNTTSEGVVPTADSFKEHSGRGRSRSPRRQTLAFKESIPLTSSAEIDKVRAPIETRRTPSQYGATSVRTSSHVCAESHGIDCGVTSNPTPSVMSMRPRASPPSEEARPRASTSRNRARGFLKDDVSDLSSTEEEGAELPASSCLPSVPRSEFNTSVDRVSCAAISARRQSSMALADIVRGLFAVPTCAVRGAAFPCGVPVKPEELVQAKKETRSFIDAGWSLIKQTLATVGCRVRLPNSKAVTSRSCAHDVVFVPHETSRLADPTK